MMRRSAKLLALLSLLALPVQAWAYREYDALEAYPPHVSGDRSLSNTYRFWKDPDNLDFRMAGDPEDYWKLNWKFMDPPFNQAVHGGHFALDRGEAVYRELEKDGGFATCLGARDGNLKGLRTHFPQWRDDLGHVAGLAEVIQACAARRGRVLENGSYDNSAVSLYVANFSNGMPIQIDVSKGPLQAAFERGRKLFHLKAGAFNFACSSCHTHNAGKHLRGDVITTPYGDVGHFPIYRTKYVLQSLHLRFVECNVDSRVQPLKPGSTAYTDLEVFLTALSNGYPVSVPSERN